ncbi:MAG: hypothetical protein KC561_13450, partial [Myxococcales bacterium]|nr:hypothetical protein [Myxococcales bacterium]
PEQAHCLCGIAEVLGQVVPLYSALPDGCLEGRAAERLYVLLVELSGGRFGLLSASPPRLLAEPSRTMTPLDLGSVVNDRSTAKG